MSNINDVIEELVTANRVLANEGIVDSFGHISVRHPDNPQRFLLSRARAPARIEAADIMEFTLEGEAVDAQGRKPYLERFIHGAIYEARPEVQSIVHNHSPNVIPFSITEATLKPVVHMGASIGHEVRTWDSHDHFGDTDLLVSSMEMGRDLAKFLGPGRTALMRGHGCVAVGLTIRHAVFVAIYLETNAKLQLQAHGLGPIKFLTEGEVDKIIARTASFTIDRAWENWCNRAGRAMRAG